MADESPIERIETKVLAVLPRRFAAPVVWA